MRFAIKFPCKIYEKYVTYCHQAIQYNFCDSWVYITVEPVLKITSIKRPPLHKYNLYACPIELKYESPEYYLVVFTLHRTTTCLTQPTPTS